MTQKKEQEPTFPVEFALLAQGWELIALSRFSDAKQTPIRVGDPIEFIRPDGSAFRTTVQALHLVHDCRPGLIGLGLPRDVQKDDIPEGTAVRLVKANDLR